MTGTSRVVDLERILRAGFAEMLLRDLIGHARRLVVIFAKCFALVYGRVAATLVISIIAFGSEEFSPHGTVDERICPGLLLLVGVLALGHAGGVFVVDVNGIFVERQRSVVAKNTDGFVGVLVAVMIEAATFARGKQAASSVCVRVLVQVGSGDVKGEIASTQRQGTVLVLDTRQDKVVLHGAKTTASNRVDGGVLELFER